MSQEKDQLEGAMPKSEKDLTVKLHSLNGTFEDELKESPVESNNNNNNNNNNNKNKNNINRDLAIRQRRALNAKRRYEKLAKREMNDYETKYDVIRDQEQALQDELKKLKDNNNKLRKDVYAKESKVQVDSRSLVRKLKAINTLEERFEEYKVNTKIDF